jgi:methanethiol oxidase
MARMLPDPTFYPSPKMAGEAPPEELAYVALLTPTQNGKTDALGVVDTNPDSPEYGRLVGKLDFPNGTSCTTSAGTPAALTSARTRRTRTWSAATWWCPAPLSSRIHVVDTKPDPATQARQGDRGEEVAEKTGYAAPHTVHCGPDGIYMNALGAPDGDGPAASSCSTTRPSR